MSTFHILHLLMITPFNLPYINGYVDVIIEGKHAGVPAPFANAFLNIILFC